MPPTTPTDLLATLQPIAALSPGRVQELAGMCAQETVSQGLNPFRMNVMQNEQLLYLLQGDLQLTHEDGRSEVIQGGSPAANRPIPVTEAIALSNLQILRIDADLLDIMLTWDQLASYEKSRNSTQHELTAGDWMQSTDVFSAESLKNGIFRTLPPENVERMFQRMERLPVQTGQQIIRQGDEGDYYYLIESGTATVTRPAQTGAPQTVIAELIAGAAFGEEALASGNKRNANVTMRTDGVLLRLGKNDFNELLKKPLLNQATIETAKLLVQEGAQLLDVRTAEEFSLKHVPGAINFPLPDIRSSMQQLRKEKNYITYCQSGRRAAAAAFLLAQHGYKVMVLLNT